jgi:hypothetical protein
VPDEEALTLVANQQPISRAIIEEIPPLVNDSEDSDEEPLKAVTLELDEIEEDEMIITYIKGEPIIGIFEKKTPYLPEITIIQSTTIPRIVQEFNRSVH